MLFVYIEQNLHIVFSVLHILLTNTPLLFNRILAII